MKNKDNELNQLSDIELQALDFLKRHHNRKENAAIDVAIRDKWKEDVIKGYNDRDKMKYSGYGEAYSIGLLIDDIDDFDLDLLYEEFN